MNENPAVTGIGTSIVRTVVPAVVGLIVAAFARANVDIPPGLLDEAIAGIVTTAYYAVVRLAETHLGPAYGWLLGVAKRPTYTEPSA